ncbi:hypothetical protein BC936DRAFT_147008 [Jimgerdemannia flammicorona]|uniref:Uncharacterized protein n=1 Tax=Jimgerdemannia flammicorona TaxID=994334 RepID=A0A433D6C2_9FUNG|nr:hypothetical protein BC936DRAFT_147008 [Jimgerdemannia flammicorona]
MTPLPKITELQMKLIVFPIVPVSKSSTGRVFLSFVFLSGYFIYGAHGTLAPRLKATATTSIVPKTLLSCLYLHEWNGMEPKAPAFPKTFVIPPSVGSHTHITENLCRVVGFIALAWQILVSQPKGARFRISIGDRHRSMSKLGRWPIVLFRDPHGDIMMDSTPRVAITKENKKAYYNTIETR